jgi:hypothetical protein
VEGPVIVSVGPQPGTGRFDEEAVSERVTNILDVIQVNVKYFTVKK